MNKIPRQSRAPFKMEGSKTRGLPLCSSHHWRKSGTLGVPECTHDHHQTRTMCYRGSPIEKPQRSGQPGAQCGTSYPFPKRLLHTYEQLYAELFRRSHAPESNRHADHGTSRGGPYQKLIQSSSNKFTRCRDLQSAIQLSTPEMMRYFSHQQTLSSEPMKRLLPVSTTDFCLGCPVEPKDIQDLNNNEGTGKPGGQMGQGQGGMGQARKRTRWKSDRGGNGPGENGGMGGLKDNMGQGQGGTWVQSREHGYPVGRK